MKIKRIIEQHGRDFSAIMECQFCGHEEELDCGYDDRYYHDHVIPEMKCKKCNKSTNSELSSGGAKPPAEQEQESQEDIDNILYDVFKPAMQESDTGRYFRRGHHTNARKINLDQFYELISIVKSNIRENFTITRKNKI